LGENNFDWAFGSLIPFTLPLGYTEVV
jgi:hypothetical protein